MQRFGAQLAALEARRRFGQGYGERGGTTMPYKGQAGPGAAFSGGARAGRSRQDVVDAVKRRASLSDVGAVEGLSKGVPRLLTPEERDVLSRSLGGGTRTSVPFGVDEPPRLPEGQQGLQGPQGQGGVGVEPPAQNVPLDQGALFGKLGFAPGAEKRALTGYEGQVLGGALGIARTGEALRRTEGDANRRNAQLEAYLIPRVFGADWQRTFQPGNPEDQKRLELAKVKFALDYDQQHLGSRVTAGGMSSGTGVVGGMAAAPGPPTPGGFSESEIAAEANWRKQFGGPGAVIPAPYPFQTTAGVPINPGAQRSGLAQTAAQGPVAAASPVQAQEAALDALAGRFGEDYDKWTAGQKALYAQETAKLNRARQSVPKATSQAVGAGPQGAGSASATWPGKDQPLPQSPLGEGFRTVAHPYTPGLALPSTTAPVPVPSQYQPSMGPSAGLVADRAAAEQVAVDQQAARLANLAAGGQAGAVANEERFTAAEWERLLNASSQAPSDSRLGGVPGKTLVGVAPGGVHGFLRNLIDPAGPGVAPPTQPGAGIAPSPARRVRIASEQGLVQDVMGEVASAPGRFVESLAEGVSRPVAWLQDKVDSRLAAKMRAQAAAQGQTPGTPTTPAIAGVGGAGFTAPRAPFLGAASSVWPSGQSVAPAPPAKATAAPAGAQAAPAVPTAPPAGVQAVVPAAPGVSKAPDQSVLGSAQRRLMASRAKAALDAAEGEAKYWQKQETTPYTWQQGQAANAAVTAARKQLEEITGRAADEAAQRRETTARAEKEARFAREDLADFEKEHKEDLEAIGANPQKNGPPYVGTKTKPAARDWEADQKLLAEHTALKENARKMKARHRELYRAEGGEAPVKTGPMNETERALVAGLRKNPANDDLTDEMLLEAVRADAQGNE